MTKAEEQWDELAARDPDLAWELVRRTAARESSRLRDQLGPNILSVGAGFRTKGQAEGKKVYKQLCVRVLVREKLDEAAVARPVPETFTAYYDSGGTRLRIAIPSDVDQLKGGAPQLVAIPRSAPNAYTKGSPCCLAGSGGVLYTVGCHHVLASSIGLGRCRGAAQVTVHPDRGSPPYGLLTHHGDLTSVNDFNLDVALARVIDYAQVSSRINGVVVNDRIADASGVRPGLRYIIATPAKGRIVARCIALHERTRLPYPCRAEPMTFRRVFEFRCEGGLVTEAGESGSPVVAGGLLIGMHFYGDPSEGISLAIPAFDLFNPLNFGLSLTLVPDHNV